MSKREWQIFAIIVFLYIAFFIFSVSKRRKSSSLLPNDDFDDFDGSINLGDFVYIENVAHVDEELFDVPLDEIEIQCDDGMNEAASLKESGGDGPVEVQRQNPTFKCENNDYVKIFLENTGTAPITTEMFGEASSRLNNKISSSFATSDTIVDVQFTDANIILVGTQTVYFYDYANQLVKSEVYGVGGGNQTSIVSGNYLWIFKIGQVYVYDISTLNQVTNFPFSVITFAPYDCSVGFDEQIYVVGRDGVDKYLFALDPNTFAENNLGIIDTGGANQTSIGNLNGSKLLIGNNILYAIETDPTNINYQVINSIVIPISGNATVCKQNMRGNLTAAATNGGPVYIIDMVSETVSTSFPKAGFLANLAFANNTLYVSTIAPNQIELFEYGTWTSIATYTSLNVYRHSSVTSWGGVYFQSGNLSAGIPDILYFNSLDRLALPQSIVTTANATYTTDAQRSINTNNDILIAGAISPNVGLQVPLGLSEQNLAQFVDIAFNPIQVCGIRVESRTFEQLNNPMIFQFKDINGFRKDYKILPSSYFDANQISNVVYYDKFEDGLILESKQSIIYTINPGELVSLFIYVAKQFQTADLIGGSPYPKQTKELMKRVYGDGYDDEIVVDSIEIECDEDEDYYYG